MPINIPKRTWVAATLTYAPSSRHSEFDARGNTRPDIGRTHVSVQDYEFEFTCDLRDISANGECRIGDAAGQKCSVHIRDFLGKLELLAPQCAYLKLNVARQHFDDWIPTNAALNSEVRDVRRVRRGMMHRAEEERETRKQVFLSAIHHPQAGPWMQFGVHRFNQLDLSAHRWRIVNRPCATLCLRNSHQKFSVIYLRRDEQVPRGERL